MHIHAKLGQEELLENGEMNQVALPCRHMILNWCCKPLIYKAMNTIPTRPRWLIWYGFGSKVRGTGFKSRQGWMFVLEVVQIQ